MAPQFPSLEEQHTLMLAMLSPKGLPGRTMLSKDGDRAIQHRVLSFLLWEEPPDESFYSIQDGTCSLCGGGRWSVARKCLDRRDWQSYNATLASLMRTYGTRQSFQRPVDREGREVLRPRPNWWRSYPEPYQLELLEAPDVVEENYQKRTKRGKRSAEARRRRRERRWRPQN